MSDFDSKKLEREIREKADRTRDVRLFHEEQTRNREQEEINLKVGFEEKARFMQKMLQEETDEYMKESITSLAKIESPNNKKDGNPLTFYLTVVWGMLAVFLLLTVVRAYPDFWASLVDQAAMKLAIFAIYLIALFTIGRAYWRYGFSRKTHYKEKWLKYLLRPFPLAIDGVIMSIAVGTVCQFLVTPTVSPWFRGALWSTLFQLSVLIAALYCIVFLVLLTVHRIQFSQLKLKQAKIKAGSYLQVDHPIKSVAEDRFGRSEFVKQIVRIMERRGSESITIGLYGEWGSGKSSIFNMIQEYQSEMITFEFKPWYFGHDNHDIIRKFLFQLAEELREQQGLDPKLQKEIARYAKYLTAVSFRPPGTILSLKEPLEKIFKDEDAVRLTDLKKEIAKSLKKLDRQVLIFIDDVDRLDADEIRMLFKLVRLVADFPNVTYLLALDDKQVVHSLATTVFGEREDSDEQARKYLEKFIQVPLYVPQVDPIQLGYICWQGIHQIAGRSNIKLELEKETFVKILTDLRVTPRNMKRFLNLAEFFLPILHVETNPNDLVYLLLLKIYSPELYEFVRTNPSYFLDDVTQIMIDRFNKEELDRKKFHMAETLLLQLFPYHVSTLRTYPVEEQRKKESTLWRNQRRICSKEYFSQYFMYSVPTHTIPREQILLLIDQIENSTSSQQQIQYYQAKISAYGVLEVNNKLEGEIEKSGVLTLKKWFVVFLHQYQVLYDADGEKHSLELKSVYNLIIWITSKLQLEAADPELYTGIDQLDLLVKIHNLIGEPDTLASMITERYEIVSEKDFSYQYTDIDAEQIIKEWRQFTNLADIRIVIDRWLQCEEDFERFLGYNFINLQNDHWRDDLSLLLEYARIVEFVDYPKLQRWKLNDVINSVGGVRHLIVRNKEQSNTVLFSYADNQCYRIAIDIVQEALGLAKKNRWPFLNLKDSIVWSIETLLNRGGGPDYGELREIWTAKEEYENGFLEKK